jgi:putative flippase GtrA
LSKLFAFNSRSWSGAGGEAARFLVVYGVSCAVYWAVAMVCRRILQAHGVPVGTAETAGVLFGAGTMMVTSYVGHRFFTYRTYQGVAQRSDAAS